MSISLLLGWMTSAQAGEDLLRQDLRWDCVNDTVMGGVSRSQLERSEEGGLTFSGELSLENSGGFVSFRSRAAALDFGEVQGLRVRLLGDGRRYELTAQRADVRLPAGGYRAPLETQPGEIVELEVSFEDFVARSYGRTIAQAPALEEAPERIVSLGVILADKQPGPFQLEVLSLVPISAERPSGEGDRLSSESSDVQLGRDQLVRAVERSIQRGVPLFNQGRPDLCAAIYQSILEDLLMLSTALTEQERGRILSSLQAGDQLEDSERAWWYRDQLDMLLLSRG